MRIIRFLALLAVAACASSPSPVTTPAPRSTATAATPANALRQFVDSLVDVPDFRSANWGILIVDPARGETLYTRNADKLFMPASNMKLLTGSTALVQLGPNFRWTTTVSVRGTIRDGVLAGDLIFRGSGDPSVSAHMQHGDALAPLRAFADSLRAHGITRIQGRLLAAPSPFTDANVGYGWEWDDFDGPDGAGIDALYFNEGFTNIVVHGGARAGDPVRLETRPASTYPSLINRARTVAADSSPARRNISVSQDSSRAGVLVTGTIAAGDSVVEEITFRDHAAAYLAAMKEALVSRGVVVYETRGDTTGRVDSLFTMFSPTLKEVLPFFEKPSQNQIGEILFKTLGLQKGGAGRADSAAHVVSRQLLAWGAAPDGFVVRDGSGLSRHDFVTPRTIIHVLDAMKKQPDFSIFYEALPIAGVDGSIRARMKGTPAEGNVHAKTGTLDRVRSLSGYVTTADGRLLLFSTLCNNFMVPTRRVDQVTDALGVRLASMRFDH
jgi:D-alanyl-D-alanine carboxypeptidase/D-alanyl-D-alanine-endopeptidase (penicillin-binding protein 4)